jgi:hypothetical protein
MTRLWLCALLLAPAAAAAADWSSLRGVPGGDQHYLDRSKLVVSGNEISYWRKIVFHTPQTVQGATAASGLLRERINCAEHTLKLISHLYYAADGSVIEYVASQEGEPSPIIPDTLGDLLEKRLCPEVWKKQGEAAPKPPDQAVQPAPGSGSATPEPPPETRP